MKSSRVPQRVALLYWWNHFRIVGASWFTIATREHVFTIITLLAASEAFDYCFYHPLEAKTAFPTQFT